MSINLTGGNYADAVLPAAIYRTTQRATMVVMLQTSDVTQVQPGLFSVRGVVDGAQRHWFGLGFSYATPGTLNPVRLQSTIYTSARSYWEKTAALVANALTTFGVVFDGTQAATQAVRHVSYFNGLNDVANGTYSGAAPNLSLPPGATSPRIIAGSWVNDPGAGSVRANYDGCLCVCAGWSGQAASAADMAAIDTILRAGGDLATSPLGNPTNYYRFANNLVDSGSTPVNLTQQGAPAVAFGCPGGDPVCAGGVTVTPEDADFYAKVRRRS